MLILTRKIGERILIGRDIWIEIIDARGGTVRIGFTAPKDVPIMREEVIWRPEDQNQQGEGR